MTRHEVKDVFLIKTPDRNLGIKRLLSRFGLNDYSGKRVALKANFNSADPFPASTHLDTLENLVKELKEAGISGLTLAERSGGISASQVNLIPLNRGVAMLQTKLRVCSENKGEPCA